VIRGNRPTACGGIADAYKQCVIGYAIGLGGLVTILSLHVILAYLRRTGERISRSHQRIAASLSETPAALNTSEVGNARVAKIISEIPQRRTRERSAGRGLAAVR